MFKRVLGEAKLWRYMSLENLKDLLTTKTLHCARVTRFRDPWEARLPYPEDEVEMDALLDQSLTIQILPEQRKAVKDIYRARDLDFERCSCVCCWHINEDESAAMWDLYGARKLSVAIVSRGESLNALATADKEWLARFGAVEYLDYNVDQIMGHGRSAIFCKRRSFAHEQEARLVLHPGEKIKAGTIPISSESVPDRVRMSIDPRSLIEEIRISPLSSKRTASRVINLVRRLGYEMPVRQSSLYDPY